MKKNDRTSKSSVKEPANRFGTSAFVALVSLLGASLGASATPSTGDIGNNEPRDQRAIGAGSGEQSTTVAIHIESTKVTPPHVILKTPQVKTTPKTANPPTLKVNKPATTPALDICKIMC